MVLPYLLLDLLEQDFDFEAAVLLDLLLDLLDLLLDLNF